MKKIIGLAVTAIIIIVVASAGSFAYFSDVGKSDGNSIQAGQIQLALGGTSPNYTFLTDGSAIPLSAGSISNKSGTATGSPKYLDFGASGNSITVTAAGTFTVILPAGARGTASGTNLTGSPVTLNSGSTTLTTTATTTLTVTVYPGNAASSGATITGSPVNLSTTASTTITVSTLGDGTVTVTLPSGINGWATGGIVTGTPDALISGANTVTVTSTGTFDVYVNAPNDVSISLTNNGVDNLSGILDIMLTDVYQDAANFPGYRYLDGSNNVVTVAAGAGNAGDMGKTTDVALWLSTSQTAIQPYDILLQPGGTWAIAGASPNIPGLTYYNWVNTGGSGYINLGTTPASTNVTAATWNAVQLPNGTASPAATVAANGQYYLHIAYRIPNNSTDFTTNNKIQKVKLYSDFIFTLRQQ